MEEALKSLNNGLKMLARRSNTIWDVLMATEQEVKQLAGSVLTSKSVRLQTEYMGTQRTRVMVHGVPVDISDDRTEPSLPNMVKQKSLVLQ